MQHSVTLLRGNSISCLFCSIHLHVLDHFLLLFQSFCSAHIMICKNIGTEKQFKLTEAQKQKHYTQTRDCNGTVSAVIMLHKRKPTWRTLKKITVLDPSCLRSVIINYISHCEMKSRPELWKKP